MEPNSYPRIYVERTLALIKPDAIHRSEEIEDVILKSGFAVLQKRKLQLSPEQCSDFYTDQYGKYFFPNLTAFMSSGPIIALTLARSNAVAYWRSLMGPVNSPQARETHPECLRAKYGTCDLKNALHGSESVYAAEREIKFMFPNSVIEPFPPREETEEYLSKHVNPTLVRGLTQLCKHKPLNPCDGQAMLWDLNEGKHLHTLDSGDMINALCFSPNLLVVCCHWPKHQDLERTLALIKPDAIHRSEEIEDVILKSGFAVLQRRKLQLSPEQCSDFYVDQFGKFFFPNLSAFMSSGPIIALTLARSNAVAYWRSLMGPVNSPQARETHPECLRAKYGTCDLKNALHGSESVYAAEREIKFMFPNSVIEPFPPREETEEYLSKHVNPTLVRGLTQLCKHKPLNPCVWLADWLIKNCPNRPQICDGAAVEDRRKEKKT